MTVEEGHVLNIDGVAGNSNMAAPAMAATGPNASKYAPAAGSATDRAMSGVGRGPSVFQTQVAHAAPPTLSDLEDGGGDKADRVSVLSGDSERSKTTSQLEAAAKLPWYKGVTCKDLKDIMPTLLILLAGLLVMIFVIPYAFSSVIEQLNNESEMNRIAQAKKTRREELHLNKTLEAAAEAEAAETQLESQDDSGTFSEPSGLLSSESLSPFSENSNT